ncbi:DUF3817 domain-containing protein [Phytomonospora endophytica]|uniref:DUF3817 domain-containing protein n=1 Tax=Phytomonospora endophytica TaxID=714109 RepID=A0A841FL79_9ACTN|nr:hypothetical protein [Phytomonospora endophytica]MBB6036916.1 hypothetical protein [Phytomonospora endophytica]GIG68052.1 hypothetical protein Pen01_43470 [Phytomonospora endophytica]
MSTPVLRVAAALEAVTLTVLLVNLATVHADTVSRLCGPLHGMSYVAVIAATALAPVAREPGGKAAKWLAWVPGIGGMLALRRLRVVPRV